MPLQVCKLGITDMLRTILQDAPSTKTRVLDGLGGQETK
jgi:hypothetical protein